MPDGDELDQALDAVPPAGDLRGVPGHDAALSTARAAALLRDRALGFTYAEIAERHGYADKKSAWNALLRALEDRAAENVAQLRGIENERYELDQRALRLIIGATDKPDRVRIAAIDARTRAAARHARLNGLDAPVQLTISASVQQELAQALAEVEALIVPGEVEDSYTEPLEA